MNITDYLTLEAYVEIVTADTSGDGGVFVGKSSWSSADKGYLLGFDNSSNTEILTAQAFKSSGNYINKHQAHVGDDWHSIAGVYDKDLASTAKQDLYIDGTSYGTYTTGGTYDAIGTNSLPVRIARDSGTNNFYFTGKISEVRISNTARSAAWIKATNASNTNNFLTFSSPEIY